MSARSSSSVGDAFLRELAAARRIAVLEALWRAHEPGLCMRLVPQIVETQEPRLGHLLLEEFLAPRLETRVRETILQAAGAGHAPRLSREDAERLVNHLRADTGTQGRFPPARVLSERWALAQDAPAVRELAKEIAAGTAAYSGHKDVLAHARRRVRENVKDADQVATRLSTQLGHERSQVRWSMAADFVDSLPADMRSATIDRLADQVVELAPGLAQAVFGKSLTARLAESSAAVERRLAQGRVSQDAAGQSFVQVVEAVADNAVRARLTALVILRNPLLYGHVARGRGWSEEEWGRRLTGLADASRAEPNQSLLDLLERAPRVHAPMVMRVAAQHGAPTHAQLKQVATRKVADRFKELASDGLNPDAVDALAWPTSPGDPILDMTKTTLREVINSQARGLLVGSAAAQDLVPSAVVPQLLEATDYPSVLNAVELAGDRLTQVTAALYDAAPNALHSVLRQAQTKSFRMEFTRALAERAPDLAFAGAEGVYRDLNDADKEELVGLLEAYATWGQEDLLAAIASDTAARAAGRRIRVIEITGRVAPRDAGAPPFLVDAASTSRRDVRLATFGAIAQIQPRDVDLARRLREIAESKGAPGQDSAASALATLTDAYIAALATAASHGDRQHLLSLLGATARPQSVDTMLRYLGGESEDDHPAVKQSAAAGLLEAVRVTQFSVHQLTRVGALLYGSEPEGDARARESLHATLARAMLGEDQAAALLYELIEMHPDLAPSALFGQERERLLNATGLYEKSRNLGEAGWPGMIEQLDIMAMCLARAAYLVAGDNDGTKEQIRRDPQRPEWGSLVNQLGGPLTKAKGPLLTLHDLRSGETEYAHPGAKPTSETMTTAHKTFSTGAKVLLGNLVKGATGSSH